MIEANIYSYLQSVTDITNVIGDRLYALVIPADTQTPCAAFKKSDTNFFRDIATNKIDMRESIITVACFDDSLFGAADLSEKIITALDNFVGAMGAAHIAKCHAFEELNYYEPELKQFISEVSFNIGYEE